MGFLSDLFLGSRPDMAIPDFMIPYINRIYEAGDIGIGKAGKYARQDLRAFREGRIEDVGRLRGTLSAINANKASSYRTGERAMRSAMAFENQPTLTAAMLGELTGQLDENAGLAFANAAADAYGDAENTFEGARRFKHAQRLAAAQGAGSLAASSIYDRSRRGGLLQQWLGQAPRLAAAAMTGGATAAAPGLSASQFYTPGMDYYGP